MQLREKIGQLFVVGFDGKTVPAALTELIRHYFIGGVIYYKRNIESREQLAELSSSIKKIAGDRPFIISVDHEGGYVFRMPPPFTAFSPMAQIKDAEAAYSIGKKMAQELRAAGVNVNFAPVLDVNTNPKNPVIGDRSFSSDPYIVSRLGVALIKGLQEGGVIACGKHFPGHGDTCLDSHKALQAVPHTMGRLEAVELVPFMSAIDAGVKSLMTAHVIYEGIDRSAPATLSKIIINQLLRAKMGYKGVVFTDDLLMSAISGSCGLGEACVRSLLAGCDICLISKDSAAQRDAIEHVIAAVTSGELPESLIDAACRRLSSLRFSLLA